MSATARLSEHTLAKAFDLDLIDLPENTIPIGVACLVKIIQSDGSVSFVQRYSPDLNMMELIGMLETSLDLIRRDSMDQFIRVDFEDEDDDG